MFRVGRRNDSVRKRSCLIRFRIIYDIRDARLALTFTRRHRICPVRSVLVSGWRLAVAVAVTAGLKSCTMSGAGGDWASGGVFNGHAREMVGGGV
jgi:hypothetical protein